MQTFIISFTIFSIYAAGWALAFKGLKAALTDNGKDDFTAGQQMFTFLISSSSWLGYFATTPKFVKWANETEQGTKIVK